jgi:hypothetical protein
MQSLKLSEIDMKSVKFLILVFAALFVLAFVSSCEKDVEFNTEETNTFNSEGNVETAFALVDNITNAGMFYVEENGMGERVAAPGSELECAEITYSGTKSSGRLEIDFGDGCEAVDGQIWKGIVVLEYNGRRFEQGSIVYTVFNNFYIDGYKIEGAIKSTNISASLQSAKFDIEVTNGKLIWPDESFATWNAERTHTWTSMNDGLLLSIEGIATGKTTLGKEYSTEITQPLLLKSECVSSSSYVPVQGRKSITVGENLDIFVDYGNGSCDRTVSISVGRQTKDVTF